MDFELDPFVDVFDEPAAPRAKPAGKFQPKARPRKGKATTAAAAAPVAAAPGTTTTTVNADAVKDETIGKENASHVKLNVDDVRALVTHSTGTLIHSESEETPVSASVQESVVSLAFGGEIEAKDPIASDEVVVDVDSDSLQSEGSRKRTNVVSEPVIASLETENHQNDNVTPDAVESLVPPESSFVTHSETRHASEGTMPVAQDEFVYELSSLGLDDLVPSDPAASELPMNSEQVDYEQTRVLNEAGQNSLESRGSGEKSVLESLGPAQSSFVAPSETRHASEGTMPAAQDEFAYDLSSLGLDDLGTSSPAASELPMNSEQTDYEQTCVLNEADQNSLEDSPDSVEKELSSQSRDNGEKSGLKSNVARKSKTSSSLGSDTSGGKLSMQLRKRSGARQVIDEPEPEPESVNGDSSFPVEAPDCPGTNGDYDYEYRMEEDDGDGNFDPGAESTSKKKKVATKRSKKLATGEENPGRKRKKKASDTSEQPEQKQPKKFSHSTRRKKRYRNDELLKVPEEEIDFRSLPMRDIIFLAEYKERLAAKDAKAASQPPSTDQAIEDARDDENNSESERPEEPYETEIPLFNSHSFMNRTRTMRWSKQETELFYEGIRQFGSDLSMIQQLFPERTRRQIKNKFKIEERRQPFLLFNALGSQKSDTTYFEKVYDQLAQAAADADRELKRDSPLDTTGEGELETELNLKTNDEPGKKTNPDELVAGEEPGENTAEPEEEVEVEDEDDLWNSYKCEF
ncbi:Transcription factor TFIIIB component B'' [Linum perenne]